MKKITALILHRFVFLLTFCFVLGFNNGAYPFLEYLQRVLIPLLHQFIPWFAWKFLQLGYPITVFTNGSGDTTYDYVLLFVVMLTAIAGTVVWSVLDRKRKSHDQLFYWTTVILRFYVGSMLVHYGLAKLNNGQFPGLSPRTLMSSYGESSPMGLAWRFLGFSEGYKTFMFIAEMMGILLFFRRTATLGALLCLMTSLNIMMINYCFDVPVKLLTTALVSMCLILLSPDIVRLFRLFFLGQTIALNNPKAPEFRKRWMKITKLVLKYVYIAVYIALPFLMSIKVMVSGEAQVNRSALYGAYEIEGIDWKERPDPDDEAEARSWEMLAFDVNDYAVVKEQNGEKVWLTHQVDTVKKTLKIQPSVDPETNYIFTYHRPDHEHLVLDGKLFGRKVTIRLLLKKYQLTEIPFRWINEYPYNR
ncbi:hypothetical protein [Pedobacter sp. JY14-1]|uniref:hypothetical protein n=1 Tax=Pedobacter sp. JY14-1 TaxID=3034151 RepID=UPI0023E33DF5|nr:hypothetical protein [Pedobacter sp. JY14-1]